MILSVNFISFAFMEFTDTHTHLSDAAFEGPEGQDAAVRRALEASVNRMIIPDVSSRERDAVFALCERWPGVAFPCLGLHPTDVDESWKAELDMLEKEFEKRKGVVAVGECGLDYHYGADTADWQKEVFRCQIEMALKHDLPLVIHSREATKDTLDILGEYRGRGPRGVFHAYSGSYETFRELDRYGNWYIGIGGVLTFKKANIADFVAKIPLERILLETDSPYLTPVPHRGSRNESSYIPLIADFLAGKMGLGLEEIASGTTNNAQTLFGLQK